MIRLISALICILGFTNTAVAQLNSVSIRASATPIIFESERGNSYLLIDAHKLSTGDPIATVLIGNAYGNKTLMDIALKCQANSYVYLAMDHAPNLPSTSQDVAKLHEQSLTIELSSLRSLIWTPISDDSYDAPFAWLKSKMCAPTESGNEPQ